MSPEERAEAIHRVLSMDDEEPELGRTRRKEPEVEEEVMAYGESKHGSSKLQRFREAREARRRRELRREDRRKEIPESTPEARLSFRERKEKRDRMKRFHEMRERIRNTED
jgi:hypothetical protein